MGVRASAGFHEDGGWMLYGATGGALSLSLSLKEDSWGSEMVAFIQYSLLTILRGFVSSPF